MIEMEFLLITVAGLYLINKISDLEQQLEELTEKHNQAARAGQALAEIVRLNQKIKE